MRRKIAPAHEFLRRQKVDLFFTVLRPDREDSLLDVGGGLGISGEFAAVYDFFPDVTTLNILPRSDSDSELKCFVQGNACSMPFADQSFDWVFSNAVIEHVGDRKSQRMMADEIRRVARLGYFIATPNWWFPLDPHTMVPFYHWLPLSRTGPDPYWMLSTRDMQELFPEAQAVSSGFATSVVSLHRRAAA
ncbi:MAG: class I SAM-dependent methyltransferase [Acidobacteria bacterium]|nr:class I SAM-dependent methyltransferase [Acidobacteriota bacterium]